MLALVGRALRDNDVPAPNLTITTEGNTAADRVTGSFNRIGTGGLS